MPQLAYTLECGPKPWAVHPVSGTACTVQVADPGGIAVVWSDGHTDTIPAGTQAQLLVGGPQVDSGANLYLIVAQRGATTLTLVRLADALTQGVDLSLGGGAPSWGIVGELTHNRVREHQQSDFSGGSLPPGVEGDVLYFHAGAWIVLHIGAANSVLTSNGTDPAWTSDADVVQAGLPAGQEGDILRYIDGAWQTLHRDANGDVLMLVNGYPVWVPFSSAGSTPVGTTIGGTNGGMGNLYDSTSGEPAGWMNPGFVPTGWITPVVYTQTVDGDTSPDPPYPGTQYVTGINRVDAFPYLYIQTIPIPAGTSATLGWQVAAKIHDHELAVWVNGTQVPFTPDPNHYDFVLPITPGLIPANATQVYVAVRCSNDAGAELIDLALQALNPAGGTTSGGGGTTSGGAGGSSSGSTVGVGKFLNSDVFGEPSGWQQPGFNDSAWIPSTSITPGPGNAAPYPGTSYVTPSNPLNGTLHYLYREAFSLGSTAVTSAVLNLEIHDELFAVYLNGTLITDAPTPGGRDANEYVVQIPSSLFSALHTGASNLLALRCHNDAGPCFLDWQLVINGGGGAVTGGAGAGTSGSGGLVTVYKDGVQVATRSGIDFLTPTNHPMQGTLSVVDDPANNRVIVQYN